LNFTAAILAWVWPGLGHISSGRRRRGMLIMFGVLFLFLAGTLIGGIDVVDRKRDRLWFLAQSLCGPIAFATDFANQRFLARPPEQWRESREWVRGYERGGEAMRRELRSTSLGRVNEIGTLYLALAGLMNLVVILDALQGPTGRRGEKDDAA
jgi:hypothetical protein